MRLLRAQLIHQPALRELQGMLRTQGNASNVVSLDATQLGLLVTLSSGARWLCTATYWGEIDPDAPLPAVQPPPMPAQTRRK